MKGHSNMLMCFVKHGCGPSSTGTPTDKKHNRKTNTSTWSMCRNNKLKTWPQIRQESHPGSLRRGPALLGGTVQYLGNWKSHPHGDQSHHSCPGDHIQDVISISCVAHPVINNNSAPREVTKAIDCQPGTGQINYTIDLRQTSIGGFDQRLKTQT